MAGHSHRRQKNARTATRRKKLPSFALKLDMCLTFLYLADSSRLAVYTSGNPPPAEPFPATHHAVKSARFTFLSLILSSLLLGAGSASVTNLSVTPRVPWNGLVDITYSLECDSTSDFLTVSFHGYNGDWDEFIPMESLSGDGAGSALLKAGGPYHAVWNSAADWPGGHSSEFIVSVDAEKPRYLVVDLNTGAVTPSSTGPDLADDACRTTQLWLRHIPKGTFTMGAPTTENGWFDNETRRQVTLTQDFYIGVFEMTQKQYSLVYGSNPSKYPGDTRPVERVTYKAIRGMGSTASSGWPYRGHTVGSDSFLGKLNAKTGMVFDLPTEAQWEYACRAGTATAFNTGKNLTAFKRDSAMDEAGRYFHNRTDGKGGYGEHTKVGSYMPNAWGLYDMHGNVLECCLDWYKDYPDTPPVTDFTGAASGSHRVVRGGGWQFDAQYCRTAVRFNYEDPVIDDFIGGFRVVLLP